MPCCDDGPSELPHSPRSLGDAVRIAPARHTVEPSTATSHRVGADDTRGWLLVSDFVDQVASEPREAWVGVGGGRPSEREAGVACLIV